MRNAGRSRRSQCQLFCHRPLVVFAFAIQQNCLLSTTMLYPLLMCQRQILGLPKGIQVRQHITMISLLFHEILPFHIYNKLRNKRNQSFVYCGAANQSFRLYIFPTLYFPAQRSFDLKSYSRSQISYKLFIRSSMDLMKHG